MTGVSTSVVGMGPILVLAGILGPRFTVWAHDGVFVVSCLCFVYCVINCVIGRMPYLPLVGNAASSQLH